MTFHRGDCEWTSADTGRDHLRRVRDQMLCALEDAGRALTPQELAGRIGLGLHATVMHANRWPSYFETEQDRGEKRRTVAIGRHRHLTGAA